MSLKIKLNVTLTSHQKTVPSQVKGPTANDANFQKNISTQKTNLTFFKKNTSLSAAEATIRLKKGDFSKKIRTNLSGLENETKKLSKNSDNTLQGWKKIADYLRKLKTEDPKKFKERDAIEKLKDKSSRMGQDLIKDLYNNLYNINDLLKAPSIFHQESPKTSEFESSSDNTFNYNNLDFDFETHDSIIKEKKEELVQAKWLKNKYLDYHSRILETLVVVKSQTEKNRALAEKHLLVVHNYALNEIENIVKNLGISHNAKINIRFELRKFIDENIEFFLYAQVSLLTAILENANTGIEIYENRVKTYEQQIQDQEKILEEHNEIMEAIHPENG